MKSELIGSELTKCNLRFPDFKTLDEGILIKPISPWMFDVNPTSE